jgi:hypothetical protein
MADERGLVISCPIIVEGTGLKIKSASLDLQELRFSLLFWDELNFPMNNLIRVSAGNDANFLMDAGILKRLDVKVVGAGRLQQAFVQAHVQAFKTLDQREPGKWSLATGENSMSFGPEDLSEGRGVLVRLHRAIPIPDKDVPLQDILEFRVKHRGELLALRYHLDAVYQRISAAGDGELALNTELSALELAISDYIKAARMALFPFLNMSVEANLNVPAAVAAGLVVYQTGLGLVSALLAGVAAGFGISPTASLRGHKESARAFRYISSFHDRVF